MSLSIELHNRPAQNKRLALARIAFLNRRMAVRTAALYLHADICRAELLVEIEGVYDIPQNTANNVPTIVFGGTCR